MNTDMSPLVWILYMCPTTMILYILLPRNRRTKNVFNLSRIWSELVTNCFGTIILSKESAVVSSTLLVRH